MIRKAVELEPMNGAYLDSLGWAYFKLGQYELAEENLRQAVERDQTDPTVHDHLGDLYDKTGANQACSRTVGAISLGILQICASRCGTSRRRQGSKETGDCSCTACEAGEFHRTEQAGIVASNLKLERIKGGPIGPPLMFAAVG